MFSIPSSVASYQRTPTVKEYAQNKSDEVFGAKQWKYVDIIINRESNWNHLAKNPKSSATGLCQFLKSTWKNGKTTDPYKQIDECLVYIAERYQTPQKAKIFHDKHNYF